jgi:glycosyltransferase involved in cell wall biosynthesis
MITILLATYNGENYIKQSVESIINQSFKEWELLIGLNGCSDNTEKIVKNFKDDRIKIFNYEEERGKAKTLNKLIDNSSFNWVSIQDDDDIWSVFKLENQIKYINQYDVIGTHIEYINEDGRVIGFPILYSDHESIKYYSLLGENQIANSSAIFKLKDALEVNKWNETLDGIEDYDFWIKLLNKDKKFFNLPLKLVRHRLHKNSNFNTKNFNIDLILNNKNL